MEACIYTNGCLTDMSESHQRKTTIKGLTFLTLPTCYLKQINATLQKVEKKIRNKELVPNTLKPFL